MDCRVAPTVNAVARSSFAVMEAKNSLPQKEAGNFGRVIEYASKHPAAVALGNERGMRILRGFKGETPVPLSPRFWEMIRFELDCIDELNNFCRRK